MLNACPRCQRTFPSEDGNFCPADATRLVPMDSIPVPKDPSDPVIGAAIAGKYEVRRTIADGGMGRVYEARDLRTQRRVAIKILHREVAEDDVNIERFRREFSTSRELDHAHIVDVMDFAGDAVLPGQPGQGWYLVMEYLDGEELRAVLSRQKVLPLPRVIRVVSQVALGLDPAHRRGFVHRDMKPDNVFLVRTHDGDLVKILDFGSVKFTRGQDKGHKLTVLGTTIGSPFYMSPEQAQGLADLDHRADVWAVAVIVYEMLVGKVPFTGPNGPQILFKILGDEPMLPSLASDSAPPQLDDVLFRGLQKKPAARFQTVGELADALGHAFGLQGDHTVWAHTSETDLATQLAAGSVPDAPTTEASSAAPPYGYPSSAEYRPDDRPLGYAPSDVMGFPMGNVSQPLRSPVQPVPTWVYALAGFGFVTLLAAVVTFFVIRH